MVWIPSVNTYHMVYIPSVNTYYMVCIPSVNTYHIVCIPSVNTYLSYHMVCIPSINTYHMVSIPSVNTCHMVKAVPRVQHRALCWVSALSLWVRASVCQCGCLFKLKTVSYFHFTQKLRGTVEALYVLCKCNNTRFEFIFTNLVSICIFSISVHSLMSERVKVIILIFPSSTSVNISYPPSLYC